MMRISYQSFLHAIVTIVQIILCSGHNDNRHTIVTSLAHQTHRSHSSSFKSPTPTSRHHRGKQMNTYHYTTIYGSTRIDHTTHNHKRPIHGSKTTRRKYKHTKATTTIHKTSSTAKATPTKHQSAVDQPPVNALLHNQLDTPTITTIASSDAPRVLTPTNTNNIATQPAGNTSNQSFGSGVVVGMGCMAAVFGLAGFLVYYRRRRQRIGDTNQNMQERRETIPSYRGVGPTMAELPRYSSSEPNDRSMTGIAVGSGHGAVELTRQSLNDYIHSSPPLRLVRIPLRQY